MFGKSVSRPANRPRRGFFDSSSVVPVEFCHGPWKWATTASLTDFSHTHHTHTPHSRTHTTHHTHTHATTHSHTHTPHTHTTHTHAHKPHTHHTHTHSHTHTKRTNTHSQIHTLRSNAHQCYVTRKLPVLYARNSVLRQIFTLLARLVLSCCIPRSMFHRTILNIFSICTIRSAEKNHQCRRPIFSIANLAGRS